MSHPPAVIIGAGPAGLAAAYGLVRKGARPLLLEKADKVGGLARTEVHKGYRLDIGGHRFYTRCAEIQRLWKEMLGEDLLKVQRLSRILYQGHFFHYPLNLLDTVSNLGLVESTRILLSYMKAKLRPIRPEESFEQWVTNRFGARLHETFFKTYTEKVWGIPCHEIRADWAAQRIGELSITSALRHALFGSNGARTLIAEFQYPVLGPGMMWERFERAVAEGGGEVRRNAEVIRLRHEGGRIRSVVFQQGSEATEAEAEHFISSMALADLIPRLSPLPPDDVLRAAAGLSYRAFILVGLVVNRSELFPDNWLYIHEPSVRVGRIQNFKNWSAAMVPDPSRTSLGAEYFCAEGDGLWTLSDEELVELAGRELAALGLASRGDIEDGLVIRQPKAYPVYDPAYRSNLEVIRRFLAGFGNLQSIGRNGMHRYNNQDHSMLTGLLAARNRLGEGHDLWTVNTDDSYYEALPAGFTAGVGR